MKSMGELLGKVLKKGLKPLPKTSVSVWADNYRVLSAGISAEPGKWRTSRAPYQKEIMDAFTQAGIHRVVVKTCSQIGKSDIMNNVIGRFAHLDPCTIMMVQPTVEFAQDFSKTRISPMIRDTKVLREIFGAEKTRDSNQTILSKIFTGGRLILTGANSPTSLAGRPIRILLCDEVDRFPVSAGGAEGGEGDPVDLAAKRTTTFWNYKIGLFSTPTAEGASRIDIAYLAGTQEEWQHQCPNCGEYHALDYRQMQVDYTEKRDDAGNKTVIVRSVKYQCPDCGFEFDERAMKSAPQKYVAQNAEAIHNGIRSFWLNGFSSPWLTWQEIMREWLEARGLPSREAVVCNTRFGLSYKMAGEYDDENVFLNRREDYPAELPQGVLLLTAAVDVQQNRLEYEICGWGVGEECWGILRGIIVGQPTELATWEELDLLLDREFHFPNGTALKISRTFIDSGYSTRTVYEYCAHNLSKQRFPIKGKGGAGYPLLFQYTKLKNLPVLLTVLGVDDGKQEVFARLGISEKGEQYFHFPRDDEFFDKRGYDTVYFKQLISEHRIARKVGGIIVTAWEPIFEHVRNESLDLRVYNMACMKSCVGKGGAEFWTRRAKMIGTVQTVKRELPKEQARQSRSAVQSRQLDIWT